MRLSLFLFAAIIARSACAGASSSKLRSRLVTSSSTSQTHTATRRYLQDVSDAEDERMESGILANNFFIKHDMNKLVDVNLLHTRRFQKWRSNVRTELNDEKEELKYMATTLVGHFGLDGFVRIVTPSKASKAQKQISAALRKTMMDIYVEQKPETKEVFQWLKLDELTTVDKIMIGPEASFLSEFCSLTGRDMYKILPPLLDKCFANEKGVLAMQLEEKIYDPNTKKFATKMQQELFEMWKTNGVTLVKVMQSILDKDENKFGKLMSCVISKYKRILGEV